MNEDDLKRELSEKLSPAERPLVEQKQRMARLMGILYGVLYGFELRGVVIDYGEVESMMSAHCSAEELRLVAKEVKRYSRLVDGLL